MALSETVAMRVDRLLRFRLCSARARPLAYFYEAALGFRRVALEHLSGAQVEAFSPIGGRALRITLALGAQQVELIEYVDRPGRSYPSDTAASDLIFQHVAIVVADMDAAMAQLSSSSGWSPISVDGPQHLPQSSGGVTAFKFRDPDGHPLELLLFPPDDTPQYWRQRTGNGPFLGLDHSAMSVSGTQRSVAFYQSLGLSVASRSTNDDPGQAQLDHLQQPVVEVTAMAANTATPHLELLGYSQHEHCPALALNANDVAASCIVFGAEECHASVGASPVRTLQDPDGHHLSLEWTCPEDP